MDFSRMIVVPALKTLSIIIGMSHIAISGSHKRVSEVYEESGQFSEIESEMRRWQENKGFHRDVSTEITLKAAGINQMQHCKLLLTQNFPSAMYIDLDQLFELSEWGGPQVYSEEPIDVEKPEYLSPKHKLYLFTQAQVARESLTSTITIPVHLRYHRPSIEVTTVKIILPPPRIFLRCSEGLESNQTVSAPCDSTRASDCDWTEIPYRIKGQSSMEFHIPVGNSSHALLVIVGTISVTVLGALYILFIIIMSNAKDVKQE